MLAEQFAQWANIFPYALAMVTRKGIIRDANRHFVGMLGRSYDAIVSRPLSDFSATSDEDLHALLTSFSRSRDFTPGSLLLKAPTQETAAPFRCEGALLSPETASDPAMLLLRFTPRSEANQFTALKLQIEALNREISTRLTAERELDKQRRWLQVTLSSISDAVIATDTGARVIFMNPTASALTGWANADALGQPLETIFHIINEETRLPARNPVQRTLAEGVITGLANHTVLIARTGAEVAIDDGAAPIRDETGHVAGVVLVFHEVTNQRNLERSLRQQTQRLLEENRRKDEYLAMLAHELRNPLAPVANALAALKRLPVLPPVGIETIHIAEEQLRHLRRLVDDLLDVSRMAHGKITLQKTRADLRQIISHAVETIKPFLASRQVQLHVDLSAAAMWLNADPFRLSQVLTNLLHNAGKFTEPQGSVSVGVTQDAEEVNISIRDTGKGIPETLLPYIFDLFVQGDQTISRTEGGLGIGLTLARNIVSLHDGTITATSAGPGKGSEFLVRIPLVDQAGGSEDHAPMSTLEHPTGLRILVVDDNAALVQTLATLLNLSGHVVETALSGTDALARIAAFSPDVVLLDVGLPGMDGFSVAREVRARHQGGPLRIIAISGYGHAEYQTMGKEAGFDAYLVKPIDHEELDRLLALYMQQADPRG